MTAGATRRAKLQSNCHHQHPTFYNPDALPVGQATRLSKAKCFDEMRLRRSVTVCILGDAATVGHSG